MDKTADSKFYEEFWADSKYQLEYAFDSAVRDRFPSIQQLWGSMKTPSRVIDFGCGNGVLTYWMHCNGFGDEIVGLDVSETGVKFANQRYKTDGLNFSQIKPGDTPRFDEPFDVLVASHVLEHIEDAGGVLSSLRDTAKWFILEVPLEDSFMPNLKPLVTGKARTNNPVGHVHFWNPESFRKVVEDAGYQVIRDRHYASAPFSPFNAAGKRFVEQVLLKLMPVKIYARLMATHYAVLATPRL